MDDVYMEKNRSKQIAPSTILRIFRWWIIVAIVVFSTLVAIVTPQIIFINENQILYYMSCLAQVIAALFALILAAYTVADTRLKKHPSQRFLSAADIFISASLSNKSHLDIFKNSLKKFCFLLY